jgi:hypothetical protein
MVAMVDERSLLLQEKERLLREIWTEIDYLNGVHR